MIFSSLLRSPIEPEGSKLKDVPHHLRRFGQNHSASSSAISYTFNSHVCLTRVRRFLLPTRYCTVITSVSFSVSLLLFTMISVVFLPSSWFWFCLQLLLNIFGGTVLCFRQ